MFGKNPRPGNENQSAPVSEPLMASAPSTGGMNALVQGTVVEGKIESESDFRVDGYLKGSLDCKAKVIIGATGKIEGNINCQNAMIEGTFEGDLKIAELLQVKKTAKIEGEIITQKLMVETGATFNVACKMGPQSSFGSDRDRKTQLSGSAGSSTSKDAAQKGNIFAKKENA